MGHSISECRKIVELDNKRNALRSNKKRVSDCRQPLLVGYYKDRDTNHYPPFFDVIEVEKTYVLAILDSKIADVEAELVRLET